MTTARRAGQITGLLLLLATALLAAVFLLPPGAAPSDDPADLALSAWEDAPAACARRDALLRIAADNGLPLSETPPLTCTDAPPEARWLAVTSPDRTRYYAFGPDGCRIPVTEAPCP